MKNVLCVYMAVILMLACLTVTVRASDVSIDNEYEYVPVVGESGRRERPNRENWEYEAYIEEMIRLIEEMQNREAIEPIDISGLEEAIKEQSEAQKAFYEGLMEFVKNEMTLGFSVTLGMSGDELPAPPPIHELIYGTSGIMPMSIGTQTNYPYTGGAFMALNTNYGNGLMVIPEQNKVNTFGFIKGSDRVVNMTNSTINAYWIMGGTTYNARFQRYGEAEYAYVSGSTTTWRVLTVSAMTDTNIQYLDETGERGIQRPYLPLETKIYLFLAISGLIIAVAFFLIRGKRT